MTDYQEVKSVASKHNIQYFDNIESLNMHFTIDSLSQLDESEDKHFWHVNRKFLLKKLINKFSKTDKFTLADVGCGNGSIISFLENKFPSSKITGIDGYLQGLINTRGRTQKATLQLQDITELDELNEQESFDIIILMDVLEHLDEPIKVLEKVNSILKKDGVIIATVPALMSIWSERDDFLGHRTRYSQLQFNQLFEKSGYTVSKSNYFFSHLFVPTFLSRKLLAKVTNKSGQDIEKDELKIIPIINSTLKVLGNIEMLLSTYIPLPFGTSVYCVANKK